MKMKDVFKRMALLVWVMALAAGFTACSSDDDEPYVVTYDVAASLTASEGDDPLASAKAATDYDAVISQVMGGIFCTTDKDAEIIAACDEVFEKHKTQYPFLKGYVEIRKTVGITTSPDEELPSTVIKTYNYK